MANLEKVLYVPDTHRPYHDKRAWSLFMKAARGFKPHTIICMGDFGDFYSVSKYSKSPHRDRKLKFEIDDINQGLDELDSLHAKDKIFLGGNHDQRLQTFLQDKAPELFDVLDLASLLKLSQRNWKYIPYGKKFMLGKLAHTHDVGATGRFACHRALDYAKKGIVTGHVHRIGYVVEGNISGDQQVSANFGWLGDVTQVDYAAQVKAERDSALGFGIGYHDPSTGYVYLVPVPLVRYSCVVEGKFYQT